uniref:Uncharacterized protein n=1 Tax=Cacopsylla melanoneura TaxID=428564 RepID=A0A8D9ARK6_9HEMI
MAPGKKFTPEELIQNEDFLNDLVEKIASKITVALELKIEMLVKKNTSLATENKMLKNRVDELEQYGRRNSVRIFGLPEEPNENAVNTVMKVVKDKLGIQIIKSNIDACHRVGKGTGQKPRAIICKFTSRLIRDDVFFSKKKLAGSNVSIKEDLTRDRMKLYNKVCEKFGFKSVWTLRGNVHLAYKNKKLVFSTEDSFDDWYALEAVNNTDLK